MNRIIILSFFILALIPAKSFSQQDSNVACICYNITDSAQYQPVPLTLGADSAKPPYYYNNVNTSHALKLPFSFCFYGTSFDSIYIGTKGNLTFKKPIFNYTTGNFPAGTDTMMIAPFWTNVGNVPFGPHPTGVSEIFYKMTPTHMTVIWSQTTCQKFDNDLYDNFQVTISNGADSAIPGGNNVEFCYEAGAMQWASADSSGGSMGFNGVPATVGVNKGNGTTYAVISRFKLPGASFYGPDSAKNGLYWLNGKSLILNTCVTEKNIPPVIINSNGKLCDTFNVCRWDSVIYTAHFLCSEKGQKATLSASAPSFAGLVFDTNSGTNGIYNITVRAGVGPATLGYHLINITATDNSVPPQTSTHPIVVNVNICDGVNEVNNDNEGFTVYPNASNGRFMIESSVISRESIVEVYDVLGKEVYSAKLNEYKTEIDLSSRAKGMYFLKVYSGDTQLGVKKIVIQ